MKRVRSFSCIRCGLSITRRHIVNARGDFPADLVIMGDGPAVTDDMLGEPFRGQEGVILDNLLGIAGVTGYRISYLNCVLCRPCDTMAGPWREPAAAEVLACFPNVTAIIKKAAAPVAVLMGDIPRRFYSKEFTKVFTAINPAILARTGGLNSPYYWRAVASFREVAAYLKNTGVTCGRKD